MTITHDQMISANRAARLIFSTTAQVHTSIYPTTKGPRLGNRHWDAIPVFVHLSRNLAACMASNAKLVSRGANFLADTVLNPRVSDLTGCFSVRCGLARFSNVVL